jgi:NAD(P)-dependent dehydrogenase (short-subunit alcohol dehydrogenase family)
MSVTTNFTGKVVLITGAASGIGRATAIKAAQAGAKLALGDINTLALEETLELCRPASEPHQNSMILAYDVSLADKCTEFVNAVLDKFGRIDCVFSCAGINPSSVPVEAITDEYWDKLMNTNLRGTFNMTRACLPHMQAGSSLVNVSSVCGTNPVANFSVYCAAKYAVIGFSKSVALEVGHRGIRVNVVAPGYTDTPTNVSVRSGAEAMQRTAENVGMKRMGKPDEIADAVLFLFSEQSSYMNGAVVDVDGGIGMFG